MKFNDYRNGPKQDIYIGAHCRPETNTTMWDDDTIPRSDSPFAGVVPTTDITRPYARIGQKGDFRMGEGKYGNIGLCGNRE